MTLACLFLTLAQGVAITHVTVVDVERGRLLADRTVLISGRHIVKIDSGVVERRPSDTRVIDGTGRFLIPGLWDMHVHLAGDTAAAARMLGWGITGARDMGGGLDAILALRAGIRAGRLRGPRLFVAGPALRGPRSTSDTGFGVIRTGAEAHRVVDSLAGRGVDFIKVHEDLSPVAWFAIARAARGRHLSLAGHVPASLSPRWSRIQARAVSSTWSSFLTAVSRCSIPRRVPPRPRRPAAASPMCVACSSTFT